MKTKTKLKHLLSMMLVLIMALSLLPTVAQAVEYDSWDDTQSYSVGDMISIDNELVVYGGDVSNTNFNLTGVYVPTVKTAYKAGEGTIVFTPSMNSETPVLTLNNVNTDYGITLEGSYKLELNGENKIIKLDLRVLDNAATLTIKANTGASLNAELITAGTVIGDTSALNTITITNNLITFYGTLTLCRGSAVSSAFVVDASAMLIFDSTSLAFSKSNTETTCSFTNNGTMIINSGKTLSLDECTTITNNGSIVNNGTIMLDSFTSEQISALNLTGDGLVQAGTKTYLNDGREINVFNGDMDFSSTGSSPRTGDGYVLNESTKTLTLTNIVVIGNIILPDEDYTVVINNLAKAKNITFNETATKKNITISGGTLDCTSIVLQGNLTIESVNMTGDVSNPNVSGEGVLTIKDSIWNTGSLSWMTDGGIALENSNLTIEEGEHNQFWTEKIVMDDGSVISMGCPLQNYNRVPGGMNGIEKYLPTDYSLSIFNNNNTIIDSSRNIASKIIIRLIPVYALTVNLNGGNGVTASGNYEKDDVVAINAGTKSGFIFSGWTSSNGGTFADAGSASTTFTMTDSATTITANWTPIYALTVNLNGGNGVTACGDYEKDDVVAINAGTKSGFIFNGWTSSNGGTFADAGSATTTFTMTDSTTTITANWTAIYALTVNLNGGNGVTAGGDYTYGDSVTINAGTKSGCTFSGWTSTNGGTFADAGSASTTFTMTDSATTITANWRYNDADYSEVDEALASIPYDLTPYTEETAKAVNDAKEAVVRGKNITEQTIVDGYATAINNAVLALEIKRSEPESPKTGDNSNIALLIALLFISSVAATILGITIKRRNAK